MLVLSHTVVAILLDESVRYEVCPKIKYILCIGYISSSGFLCIVKAYLFFLYKYIMHSLESKTTSKAKVLGLPINTW